jgi:hypothetical protein
MAFWIRKNTPSRLETGKEEETNVARRRREEKSRQQVKRLDNLRIPHQLPVVLKSLGSRNEFAFTTFDLSSTGLFAVCSNFADYPFQQNSTILDCEVDLGPQSHPPYSKIRFLGKIARVVEPSAAQTESQPAGFGIRIVQIPHDSRVILENYISAHGTPDLSNVAAAELKFQSRKTGTSNADSDSTLPKAV